MKELVVKNLPTQPETFDPRTLVHDPFILEFLDLKPDAALQESELESAILTHIEEFLLELGREIEITRKNFKLLNSDRVLEGGNC